MLAAQAVEMPADKAFWWGKELGRFLAYCRTHTEGKPDVRVAARNYVTALEHADPPTPDWRLAQAKQALTVFVRGIWSPSSGWQNWAPAHGGATVVVDGDAGYLGGDVWCENVGWMRLGCGKGPYANSSPSNWGVNMDSAGRLSGYAWSRHVGWMNFRPSHGGVSVDRTSGRFDGRAWSENVGWVSFKGVSPEYNVRTLAFGDARDRFTGTVIMFR